MRDRHGPPLSARFALVIFDLDGTLVDSFEDIRAGISAACAEIGVAADEPVLAYATRGVPLEDFFARATGTNPHHEAERFGVFVESYRRHYLPGCTLTTRPFPEVVATLERLHALPDRPRLAVATTKRTETARLVVNGTGLERFFDAVAGSDGLPHKPNPAVLARAAAGAGVPLERAVMVGDTDRDLLAARAAGIASVGVTWGGFSKDELVALAPDHVIDGMDQLFDFVVSA